MAAKEPFRVLIAGAGLAGLMTAIAIQRVSGLENVDIQLYDKNPELREIGASIALSPNGLRTLEKLGVYDALDDAVGFRGPSQISQIYRHWKTNEVVSVDSHRTVADRRHHMTRFHRGHLYAILQRHVPRDAIHLGKKVTAAQVYPDRAVLWFEDGTTAEGDLLVGADGIGSKVRQSFCPEHRLRFSGSVSMRAVFDASLVEGTIPDLPDDSTHWWGPRAKFFASRLGKGMYTTVAAYQDDRPGDEVRNTISWDDEGSVEFLRELVKDWHPVVRQLCELTPSTRLFPNFIGEALPSLVFGGRATLVGDAAHPSGGVLAAGGSLAADDALALALSLKHACQTSSPSENLQTALEIYSETRLPHTTRLVDIAHKGVWTRSPSFPTPEEEDAVLIARMKNRGNTEWLYEHDVEQTFQEVLEARNTRKGV